MSPYRIMAAPRPLLSAVFERRGAFGGWGAFAVKDWSACVEAIAGAQDREAFAALFGHFAPRLKGYFMRLGVPSGIAEDLAQDTMLAVWNKAGYFDSSRASASTWIFTIARNLRTDLHRRNRDPKVLAEALEHDPEPMPSDHVLTVERESRVRAALEQISSEQALVIRLSFFEDRPQSEIAQVLGIPLGTVKSRVRLAMSKLRSLVEDLQ
jgi:RNA polymerase sigma-70 factor (ECF subfamily)